MLHRRSVRAKGRQAIALVEDLGLFVILVSTVIAMSNVVWIMFEARNVELKDLLLLFILLEVVTMVDNYWRLGELPVRIPLYIAMVSMARFLILDTGDAHNEHALFITGAILLMALSVLVVRYGHVKFPYERKEDPADY
jgi:protein PsiE